MNDTKTPSRVRKVAGLAGTSALLAGTVISLCIGGAGVALASCAGGTTTIVTVHKTDAKTGDPLAGAVFTAVPASPGTSKVLSAHVRAVDGDALFKWQKVIDTAAADAGPINAAIAAEVRQKYPASDAYNAALTEAQTGVTAAIAAAQTAYDKALQAATNRGTTATAAAEKDWAAANTAFGTATAATNKGLADAVTTHDSALSAAATVHATQTAAAETAFSDANTAAQSANDRSSASYNARVDAVATAMNKAAADSHAAQAWLNDPANAAAPADQRLAHEQADNAAQKSFYENEHAARILAGNTAGYTVRAADPQATQDQQLYDGKVAADKALTDANARADKDLAAGKQAAELAQTAAKAKADRNFAIAKAAASKANTAAQVALDAATKAHNAAAGATPADPIADPTVVKAAATLAAAQAVDPASDPAVLKLEPAKDSEGGASQKRFDALNSAGAALTAAQQSAMKAAPITGKTATVTTDAAGNARVVVGADCGFFPDSVTLTLTETTPPKGHIAEAKPVTITIPRPQTATPDPIKVLDAPAGVKITGVRQVVEHSAAGAGEDSIFSEATVTVPNTPVPVVEKPAPQAVPTSIVAGSGTPGSPTAAIGGSALVTTGLLGGALLLYRRRKTAPTTR